MRWHWLRTAHFLLKLALASCGLIIVFVLFAFDSELISHAIIDLACWDTCAILVDRPVMKVKHLLLDRSIGLIKIVITLIVIEYIVVQNASIALVMHRVIDMTLV